MDRLTILLLLSFAVVCNAYGCGSYTSNLLKQACPTPVEFCQSVFRHHHQTTRTSSIDKYETSYTRTKTFHSSHGAVNSVQPDPTVTSTLTTTMARSTKVLDECQPTTSCGVATLKRNHCLAQACSLYLTEIVTLYTYTHTYETVKYTTIFESTTTETYPAVSTITTYPITTTTVDSIATDYQCKTASAPTQTCQNNGYQVAYYTLSDKDVQNNLDPWDLDYYKSRAPDSNDTTSFGLGRIYVRYDFENTADCTQQYENYRGYIYAPQTGYYDWRVLDVDNIADFWIGDVAYSGYNSTNVFLSANVTGPTDFRAKTYLQRGRYYPFRVAWACVYDDYDYRVFNAYNFFANVQRPDGIVLEGSYGGQGYTPEVYYPGHYYLPHYRESKFIVQFGCGDDSRLAPPFPDWGNET